MSTKYKATTTEECYFITITTVGWIDVFTRLNQKLLIIDALKHCQHEKGLEIYGYCLMSSHLHLMCKATNGFILPRWLGYVSKQFQRFDSAEMFSVPTKKVKQQKTTTTKFVVFLF